MDWVMAMAELHLPVLVMRRAAPECLAQPRMER